MPSHGRSHIIFLGNLHWLPLVLENQVLGTLRAAASARHEVILFKTILEMVTMLFLDPMRASLVQGLLT